MTNDALLSVKKTASPARTFFSSRTLVNFCTTLVALAVVGHIGYDFVLTSARPQQVGSYVLYYISGPEMVNITCPAGEGWYRHPYTCGKFYACVADNVRNYHVYEYNCPIGLAYDANRTQCDYTFNQTIPCPPDSSPPGSK